MGNISSFALGLALVDGAKLGVKVAPLDPEVCLRTELNIVIFVLVAGLLRSQLMLDILLIPLVHPNLELAVRQDTDTILK